MSTIVPCSKNSIRLSLQSLSYSQHGIYKGGYSSEWRGTPKASKKPSPCKVFKLNANGELEWVKTVSH